MLAYYGLYHFRRSDGKIYHDPMKPGEHASLVFAENPVSIILNQNDSIDEQVRSVIHELIHIGIVQLRIKQGVYGSKDTFGGHEDEKRIEEEMQHVYTMQPHLVSHIKEMIEIDKSNEWGDMDDDLLRSIIEKSKRNKSLLKTSS